MLSIRKGAREILHAEVKDLECPQGSLVCGHSARSDPSEGIHSIARYRGPPWNCIPNTRIALGRTNALRLEKKRILKEDGRYLLFYHSATSATADQSEVFAEVAAEAEAVTAAGTRKVSAQNGTAGQERIDV
jgi:hypothetical protein